MGAAFVVLRNVLGFFGGHGEGKGNYTRKSGYCSRAGEADQSIHVERGADPIPIQMNLRTIHRTLREHHGSGEGSRGGGGVGIVL